MAVLLSPVSIRIHMCKSPEDKEIVADLINSLTVKSIRVNRLTKIEFQ